MRMLQTGIDDLNAIKIALTLLLLRFRLIMSA